MDAQWVTAVNCSIGRESVAEGLDAAWRERVELWWPFDRPEVTRLQLDGLVEELRSRGLTLVAMNLWGGDLAAGERGVLHREALSRAHLEAMCFVHEATGVQLFNLPLGRGGAQLLPQQLERFGETAQWLRERCGGTVMAEPMSGMDDYPVVSLAQAQVVGPVLVDLFHLASTSSPEDVRRQLEEVDIDRVAHVQVADVPGRGSLGSGEAPLEEWVELLRQRGYAGDVVAEWVP